MTNQTIFYYLNWIYSAVWSILFFFYLIKQLENATEKGTYLFFYKWISHDNNNNMLVDISYINIHACTYIHTYIYNIKCCLLLHPFIKDFIVSVCMLYLYLIYVSVLHRQLWCEMWVCSLSYWYFFLHFNLVIF